ISPRIVTFRPSILPFFSRMVNASSKACVGCSCAPSPALMTLALMTLERKCGAPEALWRITMKSAFNASRLRAVSLSVSPFFNEEASAVKLMISAESRCSASSKLIRVRVEGSINKLITVLPRNAGTFLIARSPTALKARAVSSTVTISSAASDSISNKCLRVQLTQKESIVLSHPLGTDAASHLLRGRLLWVTRPPVFDDFFVGSFFLQHYFVGFSGFGEAHMNILINRGWQVFADEICFYRELAMSAINQDRKLDALRPAEVIQGVHGCPDGSTTKKHIIHQHDQLSVYIKGQNRRLHIWRNPPIQIIPMHADIQSAGWHGVVPYSG